MKITVITTSNFSKCEWNSRSTYPKEAYLQDMIFARISVWSTTEIALLKWLKRLKKKQHELV